MGGVSAGSVRLGLQADRPITFNQVPMTSLHLGLRLAHVDSLVVLNRSNRSNEATTLVPGALS